MLNFSVYAVLISAQVLPLGSRGNSRERRKKMDVSVSVHFRDSRPQHMPFP